MNTKILKEINAGITFTDIDGKIIDMNDQAAKIFADKGGYELIGKNISDCHTDHSNSIIKGLIEGKKTNVYTIEKKGIKKLIYQTPWYDNGAIKGLIEISFEIPFDMPHHVRS